MYIAKLFQKVLMNLMATPYYRVFGESTEYYTHILLFISFCSENDVFLKGEGFRRVDLPIASMYGIFPYIYPKKQSHVGKYIIHGSYGLDWFVVAHFRVNSLVNSTLQWNKDQAEEFFPDFEKPGKLPTVGFFPGFWMGFCCLVFFSRFRVSKPQLHFNSQRAWSLKPKANGDSEGLNAKRWQ